jgi:hypothetical protein
MHGEPALSEQGDETQSQTDSATAERDVTTRFYGNLPEQDDETQSETDSEAVEGEVTTRFYGNLLDVLMPANPPEPKNARIIRQFDVEAAKTDARPAAEAPQGRPQERRSRKEARALRNRSLRAAAGLD